MWNYRLLQMVDRKGMGDYVPDTMVFHKVFSKFNDAEQNLLKLNVVGGFQTGSQKAKWNDDNDQACELCGEVDDRSHRLLHCAPLKQARDDAQDACVVLNDTRPEWIYMPIPRLHDKVLLLRAFLKTVRCPDVIAPRNCDLPTMRFFTDGGTKHPRSPDARIATWSVVQDISIDEGQQRSSADFLFLQPPQCPLFYVSAVGIVPGEQTVARAELFAVLFAIKKVHLVDPIPRTEFVTDAAYVCKVIELIESGCFRHILHKFANSDLILELASLWKPEKFFVTKVKSHRALESASNLKDLWYIAGNMCADNAATAAYQAIPSEIQILADEIVAHSSNEEFMLRQHFQYLCCFNKLRCQMLDAKRKDGPQDNCIVPRRAAIGNNGMFDVNLMGWDACQALINFAPESCATRPVVQVDDDIFHSCLQGANIAKALKSWCELLKWPSDLQPSYDAKLNGDWGISWFELLVSFYLSTGMRCPIKTGGAGALTDYIDYHDEKATLLPDSKRSVALQILCFRNLWQNVATLLQTDILPTFDSYKCFSVARLGFKSPVAGLPCRPIIPNQTATMELVWDYIVKLQGYFEKKGEVHELRQLLRGASAERDQQKKRDAIKKVIAYMTLGIDVSPLFSEMVMASATTDLVQKKMVYLYLVNYAESNSDLAILAINTLQKDCRDDDPMIRGLALRSLCSLSLANMVEYLQPAVQRALEDVNGYVRKTAVIGVVKIFYINPSVVTETELLPSLKRLVNDNDAHVVSNTISALEEVLAAEGGYMPTEEVAALTWLSEDLFGSDGQGISC
eukprot:s2444_g1.t1